MQRLRSPFRLRPGPGAEHRKGKGRREHHEATEGVQDTDARSTEGAGAAGADDTEDRGRSRSTAPDPERGGTEAGREPRDPKPSGPSGSK